MTNIFKYQEFINEGRIFYHPKFWEAINNISLNRSLDTNVQKMARLIRLVEGDELDKMDIGYVTFSDSPKTLKFKSFDKFKDELDKKGIDVSVLDAHYDKDQDLISSSLPEIKDEIKMGRLIRRILKNGGDDDLFNDKDIESFVNALKSEFKKKENVFNDFEIVSGDDLKKYYLEDNYTSSKGSLGSSCMKHTYKNKYMNFYSINSDVVKLLIYKNPNGDGILGRSLIWTAIDVDSQDNITFMDRVYSVNDSDVNLFREYANKNGWIYKDYNNSSEDFSFNGDDKTIRVHIKEGRYDNYPYLDTLVYYDFVNGTLSNYSGNFDDYISLESTSGNYDCEDCDGEFTTECEVCHSCWECDGDGQKGCGECNGDGGMGCEECNGDGYLDCPECDGEGCEECFDQGQLDCNYCDGDGGIPCDECDGDGEIPCDECYGEGEYLCNECGGEGTTECSNDSCRRHENMPSVNYL